MKPLLMLLLALPAFAQFGLTDNTVTANNFVAIGGGLASGGANLLSSVAVCHAVAQFDYACARTDRSQGTQATTLEAKHVVLLHRGLIVAGTLAAGVATGAGDSVGAAFGGGASTAYQISRLKWFQGFPRLTVGFDFRWNKQNVTTFLNAPTVNSARDFAHTWDKVAFIGWGF